MVAYFVYIVRCSDKSLYTGWTTNVADRVIQHNAGKGAKYTRSRLPVTVVYSHAYTTKVAAMRREREIKQLSRLKKMQLLHREVILCNETHQTKRVAALGSPPSPCTSPFGEGSGRVG